MRQMKPFRDADDPTISGASSSPAPAPSATAAKVGIPEICNGCMRPILLANLFCDDGCPCNTPRGVNFAPRFCGLCNTDDCVKPGHHIGDLWGIELDPARCDCGAKLTRCSGCAVGEWQALHPDCANCCPPSVGSSATTPTTPEPVRVWPENFWRDVWHEQCPARGGRADIMRGYRSETLTIEDGSVLTRFECLGCGANCYAGLDSQRRIVSRPYPATAPTTEESNG